MPSISRSASDTENKGNPVSSETSNEPARKKRRLRFAWKSLSYTSRVTLAFAAIAAMTALVAIGVVSFVWEHYFQTYTTENMRSLAQSTAELIAENCEEAIASVSGLTEGDAASEGEGESAIEGLTQAQINDILRTAAQSPVRSALATTSGIGVQVASNGTSEQVVYDSSWAVDEEAGGSLGRTLASSTTKYATANIVVDNQIIGSVRIWVYGSDTLMRQPDQEFRNNSYQAMMFATVVSIVLASCIGFLFARNLVAPVNRITKTARVIKEGDLSARTGLRGEDEIARLGETFDEMAESMEKDRELERRLTTDVAHELRTPLMAIQSTVEAMVDGVFDADEERLGTVNSEVQRLSRLVDALLKLSRLENRANAMKQEIVDVGELISSIVSTHEAFVADSGLTLEYEAEAGVRVLGDADMIRQATANLISNAVRYTPEGGHIAVRVKRGDLMASIAVQDTGIGLSPEEAKMVFSRFWRADEGRNRASGGLGIGLSVVKEIVDRHGGWVQVEGQKGQGACFTIHIPLYDEARAKEEERTQQRQHKQQQRQQKRQERQKASGHSGKIASRDHKDKADHKE